jgi:putative addiction module component (TIGR02574 family)
MIAEQFPEIMALSVGDRRLLAYEILSEPENREFDEAMEQLLDARFAEYEKDPSTAITWDEFKRRIAKA